VNFNQKLRANVGTLIRIKTDKWNTTRASKFNDKLVLLVNVSHDLDLTTEVPCAYIDILVDGVVEKKVFIRKKNIEFIERSQ